MTKKLSRELMNVTRIETSYFGKEWVRKEENKLISILEKKLILVQKIGSRSWNFSFAILHL